MLFEFNCAQLSAHIFRANVRQHRLLCSARWRIMENPHWRGLLLHGTAREKQPGKNISMGANCFCWIAMTSVDERTQHLDHGQGSSRETAASLAGIMRARQHDLKLCSYRRNRPYELGIAFVTNSDRKLCPNYRFRQAIGLKDRTICEYRPKAENKLTGLPLAGEHQRACMSHHGYLLRRK